MSLTTNGNGLVDVSDPNAPQRRMVHDAQGKQVPSPGMFLEKGVNSPRPASPIEWNKALFPRITALRTYEHMLRNDAQVRASLRACKIPVLGGDWYVEPASASQEDKDIAEFVSYNLFFNQSITWTKILEHALSMLDFGSAVFEEVYEQAAWRPNRPNSNSRNYYMLQKLAPRPASTVSQFIYDDHGGPDGVLHTAFNPAMIPPSGATFYIPAAPGDSYVDVIIPVDKCLIFTYDQWGGNLEGNSLLRTAYKHWYYKDNLYKIDAIQKERHGIGIPDIQLPAGYDDDDLAFAQELAENIRTNERAYILRPAGWEIGFAELKGQLTNALISADHHDLMIARNVLVQFINTSGGASGTVGSKATGATMYDLFLKSLRSIGNLIADVFNIYCIPSLVDYNFDVERYPRLNVRRIGENRDLQMFAQALKNLVDANVISIDDDTERWVRREFDMPENWDPKAKRLNEMLLKPFSDPSGKSVQSTGNSAQNPPVPRGANLAGPRGTGTPKRSAPVVDDYKDGVPPSAPGGA